MLSLNKIDLKKYIPSSFEIFLQGYSKKFILGDLLGGVTVGIISFPAVMAYAIASGVTPEKGLYTAIIGGFITSLLSGSRFQIGGPTGAFTVLIFAIVSTFGYDGLLIAMLMAGIILLVFGLIGMGNIIKFLPYPVILGFTSGIAVLMFTNQIKDFFGLNVKLPGAFLEKWSMYAENIHLFSINSVLIGFLTIIVIVAVRKFCPRIPALFAGVLATTIFCIMFGIDASTIGSRFGELHSSLPSFSFPHIDLARLGTLLPSALAIAFLAGIESLLCNVVTDGMTGYKHNSNVELLAQGAANIGAAFFSGIPSTGAVARTAVSIKNGAKTPLAGMIHSVVLVLMILFLAPVASSIPLASLAGILMVIAWDVSEVRLFIQFFKGPKSDTLILLSTFFLTVIVDLATAVQVGVVIAALLFMKRMSDVTSIDTLKLCKTSDPSISEIPKGINIYRINGPFFFGIADKFQDVLSSVSKPPKVMILDMENVPAMDATAANALSLFIKRFEKNGSTKLIVANVNEQPMDILRKTDLYFMIGSDNIVKDIKAGIERAKIFL